MRKIDPRRMVLLVMSDWKAWGENSKIEPRMKLKTAAGWRMKLMLKQRK